MVESGFAVDTNLLLFPTPRRLLHGLALETGRNLLILPEVHKELSRNIANSDVGKWVRKGGQYATIVARETVSIAIRKAVEGWYASEIERSDTAYVNVKEGAGDEDHQIRSIIREMPPNAFKKAVLDDIAGDPTIVAEAIVRDVELLSSNNLVSIDHEAINDWLCSEKGWNRSLLFDPSESMRELAQDDTKVAYLWFMAHTMNGMRETEDKNHLMFRSALQATKRSGFVGETATGFRTIVWRIERYYERDHRFQENLEQALNSPHYATSLQSELRRVSAIEQVTGSVPAVKSRV